MRRRTLTLLAVLLALTAGCSGSSHRAAPTTSHSPASSGPNPDVIPAVITPAYVDAVFVQLNRVAGDALRAALAAQAVTPGVLTDLRAIYSPPLYAAEVTAYRAELTQGVSNLKTPIGNRVTTVRQVLGATPKCIFVSTATDFSALEKHPTAVAASEYWELQPKSASQDPNHLNPTPWIASFNQDYLTPTTLKSPC